MSEHLSLQQQTALIEHKLDIRHLPQSLAHLAECAACRAQVNRLRGAGDLVWTEEPDWSVAQGHLSYEQLAGYVTESLVEVEREIASNHLAVCELCANEVRELRAIKNELKALTAAPRPADQVATAAGWSGSKQTWQWAARRGRWPVSPPALAWGISLLLMLCLSGWWLWRAKPAGRQELAASAQPDAAAAKPVQPPTPAVETSALRPPGDALLAIVDHGQPLALRADGQLSSHVLLPPAYTELLRHTLANQRLALPTVLDELKSSARNLRGQEISGQRFKLLAPLGNVVQTDRPIFRWQAVAGADSYTVAVLNENFHPVLTSGALTKPVWRATQPLPRGRVYVWQVTAQVGAQQITAPAVSAPEARFQILAQDKAEELQHAATAFDQSHLLLAALYAQAGLLADAERELQALLAENPQSPVIKKLLQQVQRRR